MRARTKLFPALLLAGAMLPSCGGQNVRGIADKRSDFRKFIPMAGNPSRDGLRPVRPFFKRADRSQILRAIESACAGEHKRGSSVSHPENGSGYYVNCNPQNRQLLNGYIAANAREAPHSRP